MRCDSASDSPRRIMAATLSPFTFDLDTARSSLQPCLNAPFDASFRSGDRHRSLSPVTNGCP